MKEFKDRQGSNLKNKIFKVNSVVRNASGEIEEIYGKLIRNDSEGLTESGTELNATNLTEIIKDLIEKVIDTNKCEEVAGKINIPTRLTSNYTVVLPETNDDTISIELLSESDNVSIENNQITVIKELEEKEVTIVAKVTKRNATYEKTFNVTVEARELTNQEKVDADLNSLTVPSSVEDNFTLPLSGSNGTVISWTSSNSSAISINGGNAIVTQDLVDRTVTLTATVSSGNYSKTKTFNVTVEARELTNQEKVNADLNSLTVPSSVEDNFTLSLSGSNGTIISWTSSNSSAISINGGNAIVTQDLVDRTVTLTATVSSGSYSKTKTFNVTVEARELTNQEKVDADLNSLTVPSSVEDDFTLPLSGSNGTVISWVSSNSSAISINGSNATVYRTTQNVTVTLTAIVLSGSYSRSKEFSVTVKKEVAQTPQVTYSITNQNLIWDINSTNLISGQITINFTNGNGYVYAACACNYFNVNVTGNNSSSVVIHINELEKPDLSFQTFYEIELSIFDEDGNHLGNETCQISYE